MGGILCISIFCVTLISYFGLNKLPLILYAGSALVWLIFFWVGLYLSRSDREYKNGWFVFGMILSFILMMIETYYLHLTTGAGYGIKPSSFLFSFFVILFLFSKNVEMHYNEDRLLNKVIKTIGSISFPIYLIHCHIISLFYLFPPNSIMACKIPLCNDHCSADNIYYKKDITNKVFKNNRILLNDIYTRQT